MPTKLGGQKCYPLLLGGASLKHGFCQSSINPMSCSSLKCINCDKKVRRFINAKWAPHVDYIFVRNFVTNVDKLKEGLLYEPGASSYACQCKFVTLKQIDADKAEELKWVCGGH